MHLQSTVFEGTNAASAANQTKHDLSCSSILGLACDADVEEAILGAPEAHIPRRGWQPASQWSLPEPHNSSFEQQLPNALLQERPKRAPQRAALLTS